MSSEDFKSLILTNPDLVDEGIDVSGLRTQTDTNPRLLGAIEGYPGIEYDPTSYSYLSDLNRLFASGLPEIDTSQPATPPSGGGGGGDGGGGGTTPTQPDSIAGFDPGVTPGPSGFIGLDPEYDVSPFEFDDAQTYDPPTPPSGITSDPIEMENIMTYENPYQEPMNFDNPGASIENILQPNTPGTIEGAVDVFDINQTGDPALNPGSTNVGDQPMAAGPFDYLQNDSISTIANPDIFNSYAGVNDPQIGDPGFTGYKPSFDTPEQESTVQNIFGKVGQTVEGALTELGKIPGAIVDATNKTVDVFGKKLNVGKTLASLAINKIVGGPISLVFDVLKDVMPEQAIQTSIVDELKAEKDYGFNMQSGNLNQDPFGRNPVSALGDYEQTLKEDILGINQSGFQTEKMTEKKKEFAQDYFNKKAEYAGGVEVEDGTVLGPGEFLPEGEDLVSLDDMLKDQINEKIDEGIEAAEDDKDDDMLDTTTGDDKPQDPGPSGFVGLDEDMDVSPFEFDDYGTYEPPSPPTNQPGGQDAGQSDFGGGNVQDSSGDTYGGAAYGYNEAAEKSDNGGGNNSGGGGCVIATHAVNSGAFTKDTKREAVRWCVKNLHRKWWGEAVRRGYKYYGQKAIEQGNAKNHYQEFKDYVAFGTGKRRTLKTGWTFVYRTVQFFLKGLTL